MRIKCWTYSCLLVLIGAATVHAAAFFVDAGRGDDANASTSATSAFRTVQRAIDEATLWPGPDMIQIAAGDISISSLAIIGGDKGISAEGSEATPVSLSLFGQLRRGA